MDFYHGSVENFSEDVGAEYFSGHLWDKHKAQVTAKTEDTKKMMASVERLIKSHPDINYTFYTYANFSIKQPNCKIINLNEKEK